MMKGLLVSIHSGNIGDKLFLTTFTSLPLSKKVYNRYIDILVIFVVLKPIGRSSAELKTQYVTNFMC